MKYLFLVLFVGTFCSDMICNAQPENKAYLEMKLAKYAKMKKKGTILLIPGGVFTVGGIVLLANADWTSTSDVYGNTSYSSSDPSAFAGLLCTLAGVALTTTGAVMAIVGSNNQKKYTDRLKNLSFTPLVKPNQAGFMLTYRF